MLTLRLGEEMLSVVYDDSGRRWRIAFPMPPTREQLGNHAARLDERSRQTGVAIEGRHLLLQEASG